MKRSPFPRPTNPRLVWILGGLAGALVVFVAALLIFAPGSGSPPAETEAPSPASTSSPSLPAPAGNDSATGPGSAADAGAPAPAGSTPPPTSASAEGGGWLFPTLVLLLLTANLVLALLLYRGRLRVGQTDALVPERWSASLKEIARASDQLCESIERDHRKWTSTLQQQGETLRQSLEEHRQSTTTLQSTLSTAQQKQEQSLAALQSEQEETRTSAQKQYEEIIKELAKINRELDRKDAEIDRLREGYDLGILKKHTLAVIHLYRTVSRQREKIVEAGGNPKPHDGLLLFLDEMLDHLNVTPDRPEPGQPLDRHPYPLEIAAEEAETTEDPSLDGCIAACLEPGFVDADTTPPHSYRRAKVRLYRHEPAEVAPPDPTPPGETPAPTPTAAPDRKIASAPTTGTNSPEPPTPAPEADPKPEPGPEPESPSTDSESPRS